jgi:UDP-glucuronate 4-epimerase
MDKFFLTQKSQCFDNLAAQTGLRYSLINPINFILSNLLVIGHIFKGAHHYGADHLIYLYLRLSIVYDANTSMPFSEHGSVDYPLSMDAMTKKSNEIMVHA